MLLKPALLHFRFDNFADLPSEVDEPFFSDAQTDCNDNRWSLIMYPGGEGSAEKQGCVGLYLHYKETDEDYLPFSVRFTFSVKDASKSDVYKWIGDAEHHEGDYFCLGNKCFMERSDILDPQRDVLRDGALHIDVTVQIKDKEDDMYPQNDDYISHKMLILLEEGKNADVTFKVGKQTFPAHSLIVKNNAPILGEYCKNKKRGHVVIKDLSPEVFNLVLVYVYSGCYPDNDDVVEMGKELIDAANRYELANLKMIVESVLVRERILEKENVCDYILFADAQSCPLLKEYAISFFVLHAGDILKSEHSKQLRESGSLLSEIITLLTNVDEEETMTVTELRNELSKRELDIDGTKDALFSRLEEAKRQKMDV